MTRVTRLSRRAAHVFHGCNALTSMVRACRSERAWALRPSVLRQLGGRFPCIEGSAHFFVSPHTPSSSSHLLSAAGPELSASRKPISSPASLITTSAGTPERRE